MHNNGSKNRAGSEWKPRYRRLAKLAVCVCVCVCVCNPISVFADTMITQYSTDGVSWVDGTSYTATQDTTIHCRIRNVTKGQNGPVKSVRLMVDTIAPTEPVVSYERDGVWTNQPPLMHWLSSDAGGSGLVRYEGMRSDSEGWESFGTVSSQVPAQDRVFRIKWRAVDGAGNVGGESRELTVMTDGTAPEGIWKVEDAPRNQADVRVQLWDELSGVDFVILPDGTKWIPGVGK